MDFINVENVIVPIQSGRRADIGARPYSNEDGSEFRVPGIAVQDNFNFLILTPEITRFCLGAMVGQGLCYNSNVGMFLPGGKAVTGSIQLILLLLLGAFSCNSSSPLSSDLPMSEKSQTIKLPAPELSGKISLEETLANRRSVRAFAPDPLRLKEVSQLLWSAQGINSDWGGRTAPSAGALYPLEIYLVSGHAVELPAGIYKYIPDGHGLLNINSGDHRTDLAAACLGQGWVGEAPVSIIIAAVYERTTVKYGDRGIRYVHIEAGHAAQNACLQAVALGLGAVTIGAFDDSRVKRLAGLAQDEMPLYVIPVGKQK